MRSAWDCISSNITNGEALVRRWMFSAVRNALTFIENSGVRARFEQKRYRSAGRLVFGSRNKPPLPFDVCKAWHRPAKLISELDSSVVECEACASIVSAPKQSFADRSPIYDELQRVAINNNMLRHLFTNS